MLDLVSTVAALFGGCMTGVFTQESLSKFDASSGTLITFTQYAFVVTVSLGLLLVRSRGSARAKGRSVLAAWRSWRILYPLVPIRVYLLHDLIYFVVSTVNNKALAYKISMPLHLLFRSGSLLVSMVLGSIFLRKRYSTRQVFAVIAVTIGVLGATYLSGRESVSESSSSTPDAQVNATANHEWFIGITMLSAVLFLLSFLSILQEKAAREYGKDHVESLFFTHVLGLPLFLFQTGDIARHAALFHTAPPFGSLCPSLPYTWILLIINGIGQLVCVFAVMRLMHRTSSLTVTMTVTVRKFASLCFSVWYFGNSFSTGHWICTFLVFTGSYIYASSPLEDKRYRTRAREQHVSPRTALRPEETASIPLASVLFSFFSLSLSPLLRLFCGGIAV